MRCLSPGYLALVMEDETLYTCWGKDGFPSCLIKGEGPPTFVNGEEIDIDDNKISNIHANSFYEALQEYNALRHNVRLEKLGE